MKKAPENNAFRLGHMLAHAQEACDLLGERGWEVFRADRALCLAIDKLIQIAGEATNHVTDEFRQEHDEIPWKELIRMRHRLVHVYYKTDAYVIWRTTVRHLPSLVSYLQRILADDRA